MGAEIKESRENMSKFRDYKKVVKIIFSVQKKRRRRRVSQASTEQKFSHHSNNKYRKASNSKSFEHCYIYYNISVLCPQNWYNR